MMSAILGSVAGMMKEDMWQIAVQSISYPSQRFKVLMPALTSRVTTSISLWMMTKGLRCVEPGAQIYEGDNVTIFFLSYTFFISVVHHPYFWFAPHHKETYHYLLAFDPLSLPLLFLL